MHTMHTLLSLSDTIIDLIEYALTTWNDNLDTATSILTTNPLDWDATVTVVVSSLYNVTEAIGISLLVLCFYIGIFGASSSMAETKRPEAVFRLCVRTGVTATLVTKGYTLMTKILGICQSLATDIDNAYYVASTVTDTVTIGPQQYDPDTLTAVIDANNAASGNYAYVPQEIIDAVSDLGTFDSLGVLLIAAIGVLAIIVISFIVLLQVYGRFFKIFLYMIVCPIPLATFAAKSTSNTCISFLKSFAGVGLEAVIVIASIKIYKVMSSSVLSSPIIDAEASANSMVLSYLATTAFNLLVLVTVIKTSTTLVREMFGL